MTRQEMIALGFTQDEEYHYYSHPKLPGEFTIRGKHLDWTINLEYFLCRIPCTVERINLLLQALA